MRVVKLLVNQIAFQRVEDQGGTDRPQDSAQVVAIRSHFATCKSVLSRNGKSREVGAEIEGPYNRRRKETLVKISWCNEIFLLRQVVEEASFGTLGRRP